MKKPATLIVFILLFSIFSPLIQLEPTSIIITESTDSTKDPSIARLTPGYDAMVIKVSDDAFTADIVPDDNFGNYTFDGGLICGNDSMGSFTRIWLKFNLSFIPEDIKFSRAALNLFCIYDPAAEDESIGVYLSENDTWGENSITWNNEPAYIPVPVDT